MGAKTLSSDLFRVDIVSPIDILVKLEVESTVNITGGVAGRLEHMRAIVQTI